MMMNERSLPGFFTRKVFRLRNTLALACATPALALAGPNGGNVVGGAASISTPNSTTTQIDQSTNRAIINWQGFSVGSDEYVRFNQPGSSSVTLNRVVGGNPSSILGNITANGQIFLVNPRGVFFGQGATLDVQGLVASTLDITNENFMAGNYQFFRSPQAVDGSSVINNGVIKARENGYVVLSGDYVENNGVIQAQLGTIALASGSQMTLDIQGDGLISYSVDGATVSSLAGVKNTGELYADGGRVIMTARVANDLAKAAVNNEGVIRAQTIAEKDGEVYLLGTGATVENQTGTIDVSDPNKQNAGFVEVSSDKGLYVTGSSLKIGKGGQLLIDPTDVYITTIGGSNISGASVGISFITNMLNSGTPVDIQANNSINLGNSFGSYGGPINATGSGALTLEILNNNFTGRDRNAPGDGTGSINLRGNSINIAGNLTLTAGSISGDITGVTSLTAKNIELNGAGALTSTSANTVTINATGVTSGGGGHRDEH